MRRTVAASVIVILTACGRDSTPPPTVTAPSPTPQVSFSLRGAVYDTALRTVAQARVEVIDGPRVGAVTFTDERGDYSFGGLRFTQALTLQASKEDHVTLSKQVPVPRGVGDDFIPFTLSSTSASPDLLGDYVVTLTADAACTDLPSVARSRTYAASVTGSAQYPVGTLSGGNFTMPNGARHNTFYVYAFGSFVRFGFWVDWEGPAIVEQVDPNTFIGVVGRADAVWADFPLELPFSGEFMYCQGGAKAPPGTPWIFECAATPTRCNSSNHRLTLTRH